MGQSADEPPALTPLAATTLTSRFVATSSAASLRPRTDGGDPSSLPASPSSPEAAPEAAPSANCRRRSHRRRLLLTALLSRCRWPKGRSAAVLVTSAFNVFFAVALVITCKLSYDRAHLPNLTLTAIHLATSLIALRLTSAFGWVCSGPRLPAEGGGMAGPESLSHLEHWKVAVALCAFMALPNLSLEYNTAGTSLLIRPWRRSSSSGCGRAPASCWRASCASPSPCSPCWRWCSSPRGWGPGACWLAGGPRGTRPCWWARRSWAACSRSACSGCWDAPRRSPTRCLDTSRCAPRSPPAPSSSRSTSSLCSKWVCSLPWSARCCTRRSRCGNSRAPHPPAPATASRRPPTTSRHGTAAARDARTSCPGRSLLPVANAVDGTSTPALLRMRR
ncbi:uncharacterized protein LOC144138496 isoform X2 [Haemaphysalis longicornis]